MPYYSFREIWTPLRLFGVRVFREVSERTIWVKVRGRRRRRFYRGRYLDALFIMEKYKAAAILDIL